MLREISWRDFLDWTYYDEFEPLDRDIYQLAHIAQMLWNINRDPKKFPEGKALSEFVLKFDQSEQRPEPRKQSPEYITMIIDSWVFDTNQVFDRKN